MELKCDIGRNSHTPYTFTVFFQIQLVIDIDILCMLGIIIPSYKTI